MCVKVIQSVTVILREWCLENIIYAISISLQIVGAIILLIGQLTKRGIEENSLPQIPSLMVAKDQEEVKSKCENIQREKCKIMYTSMCLNRVAFGSLAIGYFTSIWSCNVENYRWMMAIIIVLLTILLLVVLEVYAKYEGERLSEKMNINDPIPDGTISFIEVQKE